MLSFEKFLESDQLTEKRGRKSADPFHDKNVKFIKRYYDKDIDASNYTNYIKKTRSTFLKAIEQHDKELLKKLNDDSLDSLKKLIDDYQIPMPKPLRKSEWKKAEAAIADGINKLFEMNFFTYIDKNGNEHTIGSDRFNAECIGGSKDSDIRVSNIDKGKQVFIESKLDFATSEYFKFGLEVKNGQLKYDHSFHLRNLDAESREKMDMFFAKDLDISRFLNEVIQKSEVKDYWNQFLANLKEVEKVISEDNEFKDFVGKVNLSKTFPDNANALIKIFDTYIKYYAEKYEDLGWQIYDTLEDNGLDDPEDYMMIGADPDGRSVMSTFNGANHFIDIIYMWQDRDEYFTGVRPKLDEKKMLALVDELKTIEAKMARIMDKVGVSDARELFKLSSTQKLRYFFAAFLSSTGHRKQGKQQLIGLQQDVLGNMVLCPQIIVENSRLADMICDYYLKKDKCIYLQIADTAYTLAEDYNLFSLPNAPCFRNCMSKFMISLLVSDDMSQISLHIKAFPPSEYALNGCKKWSFKEKDQNFLGKKLRGIAIKA